MTTFSNLAIITLFNITKFKRGAMLAQSIAKQKRMLNNARLCLQLGLPKLAKKYLAKWKIERASYKLALQVQSI